jgi:hypothetical protein
VIYERFEMASQCCTDVVERLELSESNAAQCSVDAVLKAFRLKRVLYDKSETELP